MYIYTYPYNPYYSQNYDYSLRRKSTNPFYPLEETFVKGNIVSEQYSPYLNYIPFMPSIHSEKDNLLLTLMIYGHNLHDLGLILDLCPNDKVALELFNQYKEHYEKIEKEYIAKYGPTCSLANDSESEYLYVKAKSPWLGE